MRRGVRQPGRKRNKRVLVPYFEEEFKKVRELFARSMHSTIAGYVRTVSMQEPVQIKMRNLSMDAMVEELIRLRKVLIAILVNPALPPEELEKIRPLYEEIYSYIKIIADLCMQSSNAPNTSNG